MTRHTGPALDGTERPTTPAPDVDVARALDLLAEAVERYGPEHVYTPIWREEQAYRTWVYANAGEPSCIIGTALRLAGVPVAELSGLSDHGVWELYAARGLPIRLTLGAAIAFHRAQVAQGAGLPWGAVLDLASDAAIDAVLDLAGVSTQPVGTGSVGDPERHQRDFSDDPSGGA